MTAFLLCFYVSELDIASSKLLCSACICWTGSPDQALDLAPDLEAGCPELVLEDQTRRIYRPKLSRSSGPCAILSATISGPWGKLLQIAPARTVMVWLLWKMRDNNTRSVCRLSVPSGALHLASSTLLLEPVGFHSERLGNGVEKTSSQSDPELLHHDTCG